MPPTNIPTLHKTSPGAYDHLTWAGAGVPFVYVAGARETVRHVDVSTIQSRRPFHVLPSFPPAFLRKPLESPKRTDELRHQAPTAALSLTPRSGRIRRVTYETPF